jgi:hypothetical protein
MIQNETYLNCKIVDIIEIYNLLSIVYEYYVDYLGTEMISIEKCLIYKVV